MINPEEFSSAQSMPTADIKAVTEGDGDIKVQHSYKLVNSKNDENDYLVSVRASLIAGWRVKLNKLTKTKFPWAEMLLAIASLGAGAIASAVISGVSLIGKSNAVDGVGFFFYVITPPITLTCLVAYFFVRHIEVESAKSVATALLDEIPLVEIDKES